MNKGLMTFPAAGQLLRGEKLLKLNQQMRGYPLPASHPKIVNGLHAFPKQDIEYGIHFSAGMYASVSKGAWAFTDNEFTIELRALIFNSNGHGTIGCGHSSIPYNTTFSSGWGFCDHATLGINPFFKMQDINISAVYQFNLTLDRMVTHTVVRDNQKSVLKYYVDGDLANTISINNTANLYGTYRNNGFNYPTLGMLFTLNFMRISNIARDEAWIKNNYNNKYALDANVRHLYNCYNESGAGTKIQNVVNNIAWANFGAGSASPIWVAL